VITSAMRVSGWECRVCGETVDIETSMPWRCPNSTKFDRHHVLAIVDSTDGGPTGDSMEAAVTVGGHVGPERPATAPHAPLANPFVTYDDRFAWASHADAHGIDAAARRTLVTELDHAVRRVAGTGFVPTPFGRSDSLSDALGFVDGGGVWVKDETGGVGGSQKARHLFGILLHLLVVERLGQLPERPPLAIASCGNAALAAATLAGAAEWPIDVYVPTWMSDGFGAELDRLGARVHRCERRNRDPAGDPAMFRFREAVAAGAIPFTVQGPENALALDGGRTIGWEIGDQLAPAGVGRLDRVFVQVGGGALAACLGAGLRDMAGSARPIAVQAEGCAPLARAWHLAGPEIELAADRGPRSPGHEEPSLGERWSELMTPWDEPHSIADGILDDETYDWLGVFDAIGGWGDAPVVAAETDIVAAHQLARAAGFDVSATGSAGLAGLLATIDAIQPTEQVAVVLSGVAR
jgi:threonine synthase